ncbi:tyrosine-protein phosphatase [Aquabacterium sp.]|uniref:tyrosine-protein phosphatase n=1 Tax=Aquabacterium sp. TaxID=1872578 RepID=UPI0035B4AED3
MIDIHTHLLPGVDDGPATIDEALALARALVQTGVTHAVVTPHVYPGQWNNTKTSLQPHFERFEAALKALGIPLSISLGGEVRLNDSVLDLLAQDELPTLGVYQGLKTLLLELPDGSIPLGSDKLVRHLLDRGYMPVLAHPERNKAVMEKPERLRPFVDMGCAVQVTAASVIGEFGTQAHKASMALLKQGWVSGIASDCHNLKGRRPRMDGAYELLLRNLGQDTADNLAKNVPTQLVSQK